jgi:hypothetical protein
MDHVRRLDVVATPHLANRHRHGSRPTGSSLDVPVRPVDSMIRWRWRWRLGGWRPS